MRASGLKIERSEAAFVLQPVAATSDPNDVGPVDFVIYCVLLWDTEAAGAIRRDLIGPHTAGMPTRTGVGPETVPSDILGQDWTAPL